MPRSANPSREIETPSALDLWLSALNEEEGSPVKYQRGGVFYPDIVEGSVNNCNFLVYEDGGGYGFAAMCSPSRKMWPWRKIPDVIVCNDFLSTLYFLLAGEFRLAWRKIMGQVYCERLSRDGRRYSICYTPPFKEENMNLTPYQDVYAELVSRIIKGPAQTFVLAIYDDAVTLNVESRTEMSITSADIGAAIKCLVRLANGSTVARA